MKTQIQHANHGESEECSSTMDVAGPGRSVGKTRQLWFEVVHCLLFALLLQRPGIENPQAVQNNPWPL